MAEIIEDGVVGRGECVPYPRYGETVEAVVSAISGLAADIAAGAGLGDLARLLPAGAARNALDCALWDLEAKRSGRRASILAGVARPRRVVTCETIALDEPDAMAAAAAGLRDRPLLKIKVAADGVLARVGAVRDAAPGARLVVDPNESWDESLLRGLTESLAGLGVEMIEQPLPAGDDAALETWDGPVVLCADEACHTTADLDRLPKGYRMVNVKLDKAGGLSEALRLAAAARLRRLKVMVGCMVATSLGIAPAMLIARDADLVDLDGPRWLARDRHPALVFENGRVCPSTPALWG